MGRYKHVYLSDRSLKILDDIFEGNDRASSQFLAYQMEKIIKKLEKNKEIVITIDLTKLKWDIKSTAWTVLEWNSLTQNHPFEN